MTYIHTDHLGSTRVCTNASGESTGTCDYEPFGEVQPGVGCSVPVNYRFAGMEFDAETGLYRTWFRQYDPSQGRWMSIDPLAGSSDDPQSLDRYAYVLNDPQDFVDPFGLDPCPNQPECKCWTDKDGLHIECPGPPPVPVPPAPSEEPDAERLFAQLDVIERIWRRHLFQTVAEWDDMHKRPNGSLKNFAKSVPWDLTVIVSPVAFTVAVIPEGRKVCVGLGVGAAASVPGGTISVTAGPLMHGDLRQAPAILSGWSWNANAQTYPALGYQAIWNSKALGGPTAGTPGLSLARTYSKCW